MGAVAPRRASLTADGEAPPPPYQVVDNESTWLDRTDLVFIDPVSTGYSRPMPREDAGQFHGLKEDIACVGDFIRLYTTRNSRWLSPKFIVGESYGTTRAAGLSDYLQTRYGLYLNGIDVYKRQGTASWSTRSTWPGPPGRSCPFTPRSTRTWPWPGSSCTCLLYTSRCV